MKRLFYTLAIWIIASCSSSPSINYPYTYLDSKSEKAGTHVNTMELYTISNNPNIDTLKMFCNEKKSKISSGAFHYIVFFDSKENAVFPNNPITAFYGVDEKPMKHIKAYYQYNKINGYSKLHVYEKNSFESSATIIDL
ncbi:MAG: hypothetical protein LC109_03475 [Bacteroidia bacterium]|nr:hypothetical protein [Bacteroidia bacterium]